MGGAAACPRTQPGQGLAWAPRGAGVYFASLSGDRVEVYVPEPGPALLGGLAALALAGLRHARSGTASHPSSWRCAIALHAKRSAWRRPAHASAGLGVWLCVAPFAADGHGRRAGWREMTGGIAASGST